MDSIFEKELLFSSTFRQNPSKHINVPGKWNFEKIGKNVANRLEVSEHLWKPYK